MINHREPRRSIFTLRIDNLCHNQHETASRCGLKLVSDRAGGHSCEGFLSTFRPERQGPMPLGKNPLQLGEPSTHETTLPSRIGVVERDLEESSVIEPGLHNTRFMTRQFTLGRRDEQDLQARVGGWSLDRLVETRSRGPLNEAIGRVPPIQPEGRQQWLSSQQDESPVDEEIADKKPGQNLSQLTLNHSQLKFSSTPRSSPPLKRGSVLIEAIIALTLLLVVSLVILKGTMNILAPRQWTMVQNVSDAYLSYEKAYAQRIPFDTLTDASSPWPVYPAKSEGPVTLGTLPGGRTLTGNVIRTRTPDANNLPAFGGDATTATNPAEMQTWILHSHITYMISGREYVKSRTIVRTQ